MPPRVAVCGDGSPSALDADARAIGQMLAQAGCVLLTGGLGGVMAAASQGAQEAGGLVIGILPTYDPRDANPYVTLPICTGLGHARNVVLVASAEVVIAIGGAWGTLSEIALARKVGRPVICYRTWELPGPLEGVTAAVSVEQVVRVMKSLLYISP